MEIPENLRTMFSATLEQQDNSYTVTVPKREVQNGQIVSDETYRVALLPLSQSGNDGEARSKSEREHSPQELPVKQGDRRTVEIEGIGDQGDGIARVERGFVVIIPNTKQGERVTVEITNVNESLAFAEVIDRVSYDD